MQFQSFAELLNKQMGRKQFLQILGLVALTIIGLGAFVKNPLASSNKSQKKQSLPSNRYGVN